MKFQQFSQISLKFLSNLREIWENLSGSRNERCVDPVDRQIYQGHYLSSERGCRCFSGDPRARIALILSQSLKKLSNSLKFLSNFNKIWFITCRQMVLRESVDRWFDELNWARHPPLSLTQCPYSISLSPLPKGFLAIILNGAHILWNRSKMIFGILKIYPKPL